MQPRSVFEYSPVLTSSAKQHVLDILNSPEKHQDHAKRQVILTLPLASLNPNLHHRYSASVIMALVYGKYIESADDPDVKAVFRCLRRVNSNLRLGLWKVDTYPFLKSVRSHISINQTI